MQVVNKIQVYPAAFPREYEEALRSVEEDVNKACGKSRKERVWGEYRWDGNRYQCEILVSDETHAALRELYPEAY